MVVMQTPAGAPASVVVVPAPPAKAVTFVTEPLTETTKSPNCVNRHRPVTVMAVARSVHPDPAYLESPVAVPASRYELPSLATNEAPPANAAGSAVEIG